MSGEDGEDGEADEGKRGGAVLPALAARIRASVA
jgi:hypothetical protein